MKFKSITIQMKAVYCALIQGVSNSSVRERKTKELQCDFKANETFWAVLSGDAVYYAVAGDLSASVDKIVKWEN